MSHTNVTVRESFSETSDRLYVIKLEAELKYWKEKAEYWQKELANVPAAIKEWGHVDFKDERGEFILTAVQASKD